MYKEKGQYHVTCFPDMFPKKFWLEIAYLALSQHPNGMVKKWRVLLLVRIKVKVTRGCASDRVLFWSYLKYCFLVKSAFLLPLCVTLAFVCVQLNTGLEIFRLISGRKVCHFLGGDKGEGIKANGDKRWQGGRGVKIRNFYGDIFFECPPSNDT